MKSINVPYVKQYDSLEAVLLDQPNNPISKSEPYLHPTYPSQNIFGNTVSNAFPNRQQRRASNRVKNNRAHNDGLRSQRIPLSDGTIKTIYHKS